MECIWNGDVSGGLCEPFKSIRFSRSTRGSAYSGNSFAGRSRSHDYDYKYSKIWEISLFFPSSLLLFFLSQALITAIVCSLSAVTSIFKQVPRSSSPKSANISMTVARRRNLMNSFLILLLPNRFMAQYAFKATSSARNFGTRGNVQVLYEVTSGFPRRYRLVNFNKLATNTYSVDERSFIRRMTGNDDEWICAFQWEMETPPYPHKV